MNNLRAPVLFLKHATMRRLNERSHFKSHCPVCPSGILLVARDSSSFRLVRTDCCIACGQRIFYTDPKIGIEPLSPDIFSFAISPAAEDSEWMRGWIQKKAEDAGWSCLHWVDEIDPEGKTMGRLCGVKPEAAPA